MLAHVFLSAVSSERLVSDRFFRNGISFRNNNVNRGFNFFLMSIVGKRSKSRMKNIKCFLKERQFVS